MHCRLRMFGVAAVLLMRSLPATGQGFAILPASATSVTMPAPEQVGDDVADGGSSEAPATVHAEWFGRGRPWPQWSRMTGDWGTIRPALERRGIRFDLGSVGDFSGALHDRAGGASPVGRSLQHVALFLDMGTLAGATGLTVKVGVQQKVGGDGASCVSEGQGFSSIDAPSFRGLTEIWLEQRIGDAVRVKLGRIDANAEFAFVENGAEFVHNSVGFSPTISMFPTYPAPKAGVVLHAEGAHGPYVSVGAFNGGPALERDAFSAAFVIGESGWRWRRGGGGRLGVGTWYVTGDVQALDASGERLRPAGQFVVLDQSVWEADSGARFVRLYARAGRTSPRVASIQTHIGAGVVAQGLVGRRLADAVGVSVNAIQYSQVERTPEPRNHEANVELFYRLALSGWLALKPDLQVIRRPAGTAAPTAVVMTVRVEVGF